MTQITKPAPLIWINGFPGVGKLTIAKELAARDNRVIVIDNHSLIDPVAKRLGPNSRDHPDYQKLRREERDRVFRKYVLGSEFQHNILVFTDFQSMSQLGCSVAHEYKIVAEQSGRPFVPFHLACDFEENMWRAMSTQRKESGTTKLTDERLLDYILKHDPPYRFQESVSIQVTRKKPEEVAYCILEHSCDNKGKA